MNKKIAVFGGSSPRPGDPAYEDALRLGKLLAQSGYTVMTGGYIGIMEAASRGAAEAGGHVIGATCDEIEAWRPVGPNQWVMEEFRFPTLRERLNALVDTCDAAIAMPGGVGTLAEIAVMWNGMQINSRPTRPLVLVGTGWRQTFESMLGSLQPYIPVHHRNLIMLVDTPEEAVKIIQDTFGTSAA